MIKATTSSKKVRFKGNPRKMEFIKDYRRRVEAYFEENNLSPYANNEMYLKTLFSIFAWIGTWSILLSNTLNNNPIAFYLTYMLLGFINIFIGFNIMHDATHNAYSPNKKVNKLLGYSMDFIGGNQYLFKRLHGSHHGYVNIHGIDATLETHGLFRFSPDEPWKPKHRYQHYYTFILYAFAMLQWVTIKDFKWFFGENHIGNEKEIKHPFYEYLILIFGKSLYFGLTLFIPLFLVSMPWYQILGAWIFMHIIPGLTFALIFQITHIYEGTTFPLPDEEGNIDNNYALHVIETTADFSRKSKICSWLTGGLNTHVIHHIFPQVCHVHYPKLTDILKEICDEYGIEYQENPNFWVALKRHFIILKKLSFKDAVVPRVGKSASFV
jgi:linoleoyl-CoA desaturase